MKNSRIVQGLRVALGRAPDYQYPYRQYNIDHRAIFIHIPKTAGTSIREAMGASRQGRLHIDYSHFRRSDRDRFRDYYKFTVVRDPVDRMFSGFNYIRSGGNKGTDDQELAALLNRVSPSFSDFVKFAADEQLHTLWPLLWPQSYFLCDAAGRLQVDQVLYQENLAEDYTILRENVRTLPEELPELNVSSAKKRKDHPIETRRAITQLYPKDYALFYPDELARIKQASE